MQGNRNGLGAWYQQTEIHEQRATLFHSGEPEVLNCENTFHAVAPQSLSGFSP